VPAGQDPIRWRVLIDVVFPRAQDPAKVLLALDYCRVRGLDVMKRPVNIVPMWDNKTRKYVDSIWPSINEIEVTAARTGQYAGCDPPVFGTPISREFRGRLYGENSDTVIKLTFPETCAVTVYRLVAGQRCGFTVPVRWLEEYGRQGGSELPTYMWGKRPYDQFGKVARAASLRAAFPEEEGNASDVEMAGQQIIDEDPRSQQQVAPQVAGADNWQPPPTEVLAAAPGDQPEPAHDPETGELVEPQPPPPPPAPRLMPLSVVENVVEDWRSWGSRFIAAVRAADAIAIVDEWQKLNAKILDTMLDEAPKMHAHLIAAVAQRKIELGPK
jgi:phage recombination protein Bet